MADWVSQRGGFEALEKRNISCLCLKLKQILGCPSRTLVTILTELSRFPAVLTYRATELQSFIIYTPSSYQDDPDKWAQNGRGKQVLCAVLGWKV
jgi:hypothetical protein